ncbi:hypothetical protein [Olleya sp. ITB9]|uniref:hypothetical protein n=1 Tax=Olleya sp. ITB9 TaxID=1715648 RepID=UPI0006D23F4E|nr:hypothetical protein [Olleya sp. ITB9]
MFINSIIIIVTSMIGAILTFYISESLNQGAVRASSLLALLVGLFFYVFPDVLNVYLTKSIPVVFIGATFIGMASPKGHNNYLLLAVAGVLFSLVYINKSRFFNGYGGALGTLAFITLLSTLALNHIFSRHSPVLKHLQSIKNKVFKHKS